MQLKYRVLGLGTVVVALTAVMVPVAEATAGGAPARADVTSVVERRRVDGVATPRLRWKACRDLSPRAEVPA